MAAIYGITLDAVFNTFIFAFVTGLAAATVAALVRIVRRLKRMDTTVRTMQHGQRHTMRWMRRAGQKIDLPFPLEEDALDYFERNPEGDEKGPLL